MKQADTKESFTLSPQRLEKAAEAIDPRAFNKEEYDRSHGWGDPSQADAQRIAIEKAQAAISAYLGDDMVVVPREPTEAMVDAAYETFGCHEIFRVEEIEPSDIYRAMLSAELTERDAG
jgi:hypothetical protein